MIEFGLSVQALTNHMKAAKLNAHLNNPTLLEELAEKLPGDMKLNWAAYQEEKAIEELEGFSNYVSGCQIPYIFRKRTHVRISDYRCLTREQTIPVIYSLIPSYAVLDLRGFGDTRFSKFDRSNVKSIQFASRTVQCTINCIFTNKLKSLKSQNIRMFCTNRIK